MERLSFIDWMVKYEIADNKEEAIGYIKRWADILISPGLHKGDCTHEAQPCEICGLEIMLEEYDNYSKNWRIEK